MQDITCAFTGHRHTRFAFGDDEDDERYLRLTTLMREHIRTLIAGGVTEFLSGMATGADQWAAEIILDIKKEYPHIRLTAVRPYAGQAKAWPPGQQERHYNTLAQCNEVVTIRDGYTRSCMFERNRYLVDNAAFLLAVYDGGSTGGTAYTVKYAKQKKRRMTIIHPDSLDVEIFPLA
jgi:uncharacterized phage-like protein YoqJ